ncbi:DUF397 domain-containing protein [Streptomyces sp. NPDC008121]|uniref:DUF397 domain-containing protein n=1 Tax=Streptomyces sp. NPDC008121 TaxID=3364809 RepID=UPI0036F03F4D
MRGVLREGSPVAGKVRVHRNDAARHYASGGSRRTPAGESQCVEIADVPPWGGVAVRDSKNPRGPAIAFEMAAFAVLITTIQDARFAG